MTLKISTSRQPLHHPQPDTIKLAQFYDSSRDNAGPGWDPVWDTPTPAPNPDLLKQIIEKAKRMPPLPSPNTSARQKMKDALRGLMDLPPIKPKQFSVPRSPSRILPNARVRISAETPHSNKTSTQKQIEELFKKFENLPPPQVHISLPLPPPPLVCESFCTGGVSVWSYMRGYRPGANADGIGPRDIDVTPLWGYIPRQCQVICK